MIMDNVDVDMLILDKVSRRVKERVDSLEKLVDPKFEGHGMGIEGWLKVEAIAALQPHIDKVRNRGPDLKIFIHDENREIELKGHNMHTWSLAKHGIEQHEKKDTPINGCLFLARMPQNPDKEKGKIENSRFELLPRKISNNWFVGLLKKKTP
jgi:hypothetical protein